MATLNKGENDIIIIIIIIKYRLKQIFMGILISLTMITLNLKIIV